MNRQEFEKLRDLPDKRITADIVWSQPRDMKPNLVFEKVAVENGLGHRILLNGTYKPHVPAVSFNFQVVGVGAVCRVEVNGPIHRNSGRTHKHDLRNPRDPENNLPSAAQRDDLEDKTPREVWEDLCNRANIIHTGNFQDPEPISDISQP